MEPTDNPTAEAPGDALPPEVVHRSVMAGIHNLQNPFPSGRSSSPTMQQPDFETGYHNPCGIPGASGLNVAPVIDLNPRTEPAAPTPLVQIPNLTTKFPNARTVHVGDDAQPFDAERLAQRLFTEVWTAVSNAKADGSLRQSQSELLGKLTVLITDIANFFDAVHAFKLNDLAQEHESVRQQCVALQDAINHQATEILQPLERTAQATAQRLAAAQTALANHDASQPDPSRFPSPSEIADWQFARETLVRDLEQANADHSQAERQCHIANSNLRRLKEQLAGDPSKVEPCLAVREAELRARLNSLVTGQSYMAQNGLRAVESPV
jgi:hypothetical protein